MFTILYTVYITYAAYSHGYAAVSTEQIGQYQTAEQCEIIAKQLRESDGSRRWTTARCVQTK